MEYSDRLIELNSDSIIFRHYYFPIGGSKRVLLDNVKQVESLRPTLLNGKWRLWGTSTLRRWFPLDFKRPSRDRIFRITLNSGFQIGFTAENGRTVEDLFKRKGLLTA